MIFWIGFITMVLNEGFVIMRHVHPWFANKRDQLIKKYGTKWKRFHSTLDYVWIGCVSIGILIDLENCKLYATVLLVFWSIVGIFVYLPLWWRKYNHEI